MTQSFPERRGNVKDDKIRGRPVTVETEENVVKF
jgi:hypothetical protein